jgi:glycosyltransferase involved in cell wall biosynthesis
MGRAAQQQGFEVDVLATDPRFQDMILREGLGLIDLQVIWREIRPLRDVRGLLGLNAFLARSPYAIVHTHTSKPGIVGRLAATRAHVPVVIHTVHGFGFHEETGRLATAAYIGLERIAARWCDLVVTVSDFHRDWALRVGIGDPDKVISIPNGVPRGRVEPTRTPAEVRAEFGIGQDFMVLSTGRLAEQKGLEYLVRAAALLRADMPDLKIVLSGDGPLRAHLSTLVSQLGVERTVMLLGFRSDIGDLMAAADLVVLPSLWEGLSISLLEAMAAGKPVLTTSIGSNREVTNEGEAALLVPPKDPAALATGIRSLAGDEARRHELGQRGLETQRGRYSLERMLEAYSREYHRLLGRKMPGASVRKIHVGGVA